MCASVLERYRLLGGPYAAPRCQVGRKLYCHFRRRRVKVNGLTEAPIIWPFTRPRGPRSLIVCGDLVRAVQEESVLAVAHHWQVSRETVWRWRKALGVEQFTAGTRQLIRDTIPEKVDLGRLAEARIASRTPEARAKMSAARRGKKPSAAFLAAARKAATQPKSESFRAQFSKRLRREWASGARRAHAPGQPWKEIELARVGKAPDAVIARELGRTVAAVQKVRIRLGLPCLPGT